MKYYLLAYTSSFPTQWLVVPRAEGWCEARLDVGVRSGWHDSSGPITIYAFVSENASRFLLTELTESQFNGLRAVYGIPPIK